MPESLARTSPNARDDDLLANAIPIDASDVDDDVDDRLDLEPDDAPAAAGDGHSSKIRTFAQKRGPGQQWRRKPNTTGHGAAHVRTFVSKLRLEALEHLDEQVNDWLDEHPDYEVKLVTTSVGQLIGKNPEDALIMNVWV